jgi:hypothetical protein
LTLKNGSVLLPDEEELKKFDIEIRGAIRFVASDHAPCPEDEKKPDPYGQTTQAFREQEPCSLICSQRDM